MSNEQNWNTDGIKADKWLFFILIINLSKIMTTEKFAKRDRYRCTGLGSGIPLEDHKFYENTLKQLHPI